MSKQRRSKGPLDMATLDSGQKQAAVFQLVDTILGNMGVAGCAADSVIVAPPFYDGEVLLKDGAEFYHFIDQFAGDTGCLGYAFNDVAFLTVEQFCSLYVEDSYPDYPDTLLSGQQYVFRGRAGRGGATDSVQTMPICFVLGSPRSGTTLFRTMLNSHQQLWAPGELSLAHFKHMAQRAAQLLPQLRYSIVPELAARLGESMPVFAQRLKTWEREALATADVYQLLQRADPDRCIVDKSPAYSMRLENLQGIGRQFTQARYIHVIRNPCDVIRSFVKLQMYKNTLPLFERGLSPYQMGEIFWFVHNANIEQFLSQIPAERQCVVRYEDIVGNTRQPLAAACKLLDIRYDPAMEDPYQNKNQHGGDRGEVALGASDVNINAFHRVENRVAGTPFYPLGQPCLDMADRYGYRFNA